ncbi:MAG: alpha/beta fold hydrolase [Ottowia sp.]|nr:alpha/beta fold hydrolase [Ottowia sp.]
MVLTSMWPALRRSLVLAAAVLTLGGCAAVSELQPAVSVRTLAPGDYVTQRRGDVLSSGRLSALSTQTLRVTGLDQQACKFPASPACTTALAAAGDLDDETRLSALAELWLQRALSGPAAEGRANLVAWIETARHAYAYLFFTARAPSERAFEERQTQVRDWYNHAVQQVVTQLFLARDPRLETATAASSLHVDGWTVHINRQLRLPDGVALPQELLPASALAFRGLRGHYRRDGLGAELVAVTQAPVQPEATTPSGTNGRELPQAAWSEMPTPNLTAVLRFNVDTLAELLTTHELTVDMHDPLLQEQLLLQGRRVPLAGDFSAGYGLWLARSGFSRQSLRGLLGREPGLERPHLYLMQPWDPGRRIIVMLHGLASSPEAWVNMANELMADDELRREFQIWQVYYPTNMPLPASHAAIRQVLQGALQHFDPDGRAPASHGLVLIGHSMGGIIARLLVSSADEQLLQWAASDPRIGLELSGDTRAELEPLLRFQPFPGVQRAIFIATPHRGTAVAGKAPVRWLSGLIRLPLTLLEGFGNVLATRALADTGDAKAVLDSLPRSTDQLDQDDPFIQAAARLPIPPEITYHSIIARLHAEGELADSDDGLVPYCSAHLAGAASEKIIVSGHSVQETPAAVAELRRILREDIHAQRPPGAARAQQTDGNHE